MCVSAPEPIAAILDHTFVSGMLVEEVLIDTGTHGLSERCALAARCARAGLGYCEWDGQWLSPGVEFGFQLFTGSRDEERDRLRPVLDALAPFPGAWLYCGPQGAGYFAAKVFDALTMAYTLALREPWPSAENGMLRAPDWGVFFSEQQLLADKLLQFSHRYLALYPESAYVDVSAVLEAFNCAPAFQAHFSANLARLIVLALQHNHAQQDIFDSIIKRPFAV
jgi:hypothetical protein